MKSYKMVITKVWTFLAFLALVPFCQAWDPEGGPLSILNLDMDQFAEDSRMVTNFSTTSLGRVSFKCRYHVKLYQEHMAQPISNVATNLSVFWALKMFDASGRKIREGMLSGNMGSLGSPRSCLDVEASERGGPSGGLISFTGKYSTAMVFLRLPKPLQFGICLPSSCTKEDIRTLLTRLFQGGTTRSAHVLTRPPHVKSDTYTFDYQDRLMISFMFFLLVLVATGTALEGYYSYQILQSNDDVIRAEDRTAWIQFLLGFGLHSNCKWFLQTVAESPKPRQADQSPQGGVGTHRPSAEHLTCLDGIRFISMTWVVVGHTFSVWGNVWSAKNLFQMKDEIMGNYMAQAITNPFTSVDTFFMVSGCLVTYLTLKELDKTKGRLNFGVVLIHRYLRLTGSYALILLLHMTLMRAFATAPNSNSDEMTSKCREFGWKNFLYIGIYKLYDGDKITPCVPQGWYLDNDMQMFLVTPIIVTLMWRTRLVGLALTVLLCLGSMILTMVMGAAADWPSTVLLGVANRNFVDFYVDSYIKPWHRFPPYAVGMLLGFLLYHTRDRKQFPLNKFAVLGAWTMAFLIGFATVYGLNIPLRIRLKDPQMLAKASNVAYLGLHRFAWAVANAWVVFACCRGHGGWVNELLSWKAFQPLAKLSFIVYLTHKTVIEIMGYYQYFPSTVSFFLGTIYSIAVLAYSGIVSFLVLMTFEFPWIKTEKLVVGSLFGGK